MNKTKLNEEYNDELGYDPDRLPKRGKKTWTDYEFRLVLSQLNDKERKELFDELVADCDERYKDDKVARAFEYMFLLTIFGRKNKITTRTMADAWGVSHVAVAKFIKRTEAKYKEILGAGKSTNYRAALSAVGKLDAMGDRAREELYQKRANDYSMYKQRRRKIQNPHLKEPRYVKPKDKREA